MKQQVTENMYEKFILFTRLSIYLDTIETQADYNYNSDGFEEPE